MRWYHCDKIFDWGIGSMLGEAYCISCSTARALIAVAPVARGYGLKLYECPCCHSTLRLVTRVTKATMVKQQCGRKAPPETFAVHEASIGRPAGAADDFIRYGDPTIWGTVISTST